MAGHDVVLAFRRLASAPGRTVVRVAGDHFVVIDPDSPAWQAQLEILDSIA